MIKYIVLYIIYVKTGSFALWIYRSPNGLGGTGSNLVRVIPKTLKMVFDAYLLNTLYYNVRIEGKVE